MNRSITVRAAAYTLTWSLRTPGDRRPDEAPSLTLSWALQANETLYVTDRLWDHGADRRPTADARGVYTFVRDGALRLVFAPPPPPPRVQLRNVYRPFASRVAAGETLRREVEVPLPAVEYSALARNVQADAVLERVSHATLILAYQRRAALPADPAPAPFVTHPGEGFVVFPTERAVSSMEVDPLPVRRRTDAVARYLLPGEAP